MPPPSIIPIFHRKNLAWARHARFFFKTFYKNIYNETDKPKCCEPPTA
ncbi:MAG: hypothetical protein RL757_1804 [Bacteroidota bacterium]|jgi:hypothetical protein